MKVAHNCYFVLLHNEDGYHGLPVCYHYTNEFQRIGMPILLDTGVVVQVSWYNARAQ